MADWCEGILGLPSPVLLDGGLEGLCGQVGCGAWVRDTVNDKNMHTLYEPSLVRSLSKGHTHSRKLTWNLLSPLPLLRAAAIWCFSRLSRDTPAMVGPESLPLLHWPLSQHTSLSWPQSHPHGTWSCQNISHVPEGNAAQPFPPPAWGQISKNVKGERAELHPGRCSEKDSLHQILLISAGVVLRTTPWLPPWSQSMQILTWLGL